MTQNRDLADLMEAACGLATLRRPFPLFGGTEGALLRHPGTIRRREGKVMGANWHVFLETCDFDAAWASVPRPGIVVTEGEIRNDPVLQPLLDEWRSGDDSAYRRFRQHVLDWTADEDDPN
jgi:hypothetical protein